VFRVQGTLPNMEIYPNIARFSPFPYFPPSFLLFLYLDTVPEYSPFNIRGTANIIIIFLLYIRKLCSVRFFI
jgi:hypothetical protein